MKKKIGLRTWGMIFGTGAFIVSAYFTCDLLISEATLGREKFVHLLWGLVCQGLLAIFCTGMFVNKGLKQFICGFLFLLALMLSLHGTISQRAMNRQVKLNSEIANDGEYSDLKADQKRLKDKIDKFDEKILQFTEDKMIKHGKTPTEKKRKEAKAELDDIERRLANYTHKTGSETNAPYIAWARFNNEEASEEEIVKSAERTHMWVTIGYAVLLDLGGPVAFGIIVSSHVTNYINRRRRRRESETDIESIDEPENLVRPQFSSYNTSQQNEEMVVERIDPSSSASQVSDTEPRIPTLPEDTSLDEMPRNRNGKISGFSKSTLLEHIKNMFHDDGTGPKDGHLRGQKRTAEIYNAVHDVGAMAHQWLKENGLIKVKGRYSYPEMSQAEMLNRVTETYSH